MIPNRQQIIDKIDELRIELEDRHDDIKPAVEAWLRSLNLQPVMIAGVLIDPVAQILNDLESYENF